MPRVAGAASSQPCCATQSWLHAGIPAWWGGHRPVSPNRHQTLPSPTGQPGSGSTAGKPQALRESPALPVPVSPSAAGSTRIPQPWGTPRLWPRPLVGPGEGRAEQTRLEPRESPRREGAGAWTRLAPTPRSHQQRRDPGGNDPTPSLPRFPTQHPIPGGGPCCPAPPPVLTAPTGRGWACCPGTAVHGGAPAHACARASTWLWAHPHPRTRVCTPWPRCPG